MTKQRRHAGEWPHGSKTRCFIGSRQIKQSSIVSSDMENKRMNGNFQLVHKLIEI